MSYNREPQLLVPLFFMGGISQKLSKYAHRICHKAFVLCLTVCIILGFVRMLHFFSGNIFNAVVTMAYVAIIVSFVGSKKT